MQRFRVVLSATASVGSAVNIDAVDEAEAKRKAIQYANEGGVIWEYQGVIDGTIEADEANESQSQGD